MTNCDRSHRPIRHTRSNVPGIFPRIGKYTLSIPSLRPPREGGRVYVRREFTDCDCVWRNPYFGWGDGERKVSLSLFVMRNYSGTGEEIGEIPQQGCALSRSFFARIIPEGEGEKFSGRVNMVRVNEACDLSPLFWITFAWVLLR